MLLRRTAKKILIVDDVHEIRETLRDCLELRGYEIEVAGSGAEAIKKVPSFQPELIILDLAMPGRSGFEVLNDLKKSPETKNIPVFILSVKDELGDYRKGMMLGACEYIVKPFSLKALWALIENTFRNNSDYNYNIL